MPIGGERPDPPKGLVVMKEIVKKNTEFFKEIKDFFMVNCEIIIIFMAIIVGSNLHEWFPNWGTGGKWNIYLFGQQLFGASSLYTLVYFLRTPKENIFQRSFSRGLFILSLYAAIGEFSAMYGEKLFSQSDKGLKLFAEFSFLAGITFAGMYFSRKNGK